MDREEALDFLANMAKGIALMFGDNCETIVQELKDGKFTALKIYNGHVSGREAMSTQGILGDIIETDKLDFESMESGVFNQLVMHPSGKKIKSSSFPVKGNGYMFFLGINYDITVMSSMNKMLKNFISSEGDLFEAITKDKDTTLDSLYESCVSKMNVSVEMMKKEERLVLVQLLNSLNFFDIQKSVPFLSGKLGVSKYTIYKYFNEVQERIS